MEMAEREREMDVVDWLKSYSCLSGTPLPCVMGCDYGLGWVRPLWGSYEELQSCGCYSPPALLCTNAVNGRRARAENKVHQLQRQREQRARAI